MSFLQGYGDPIEGEEGGEGGDEEGPVLKTTRHLHFTGEWGGWGKWVYGITESLHTYTQPKVCILH